MTRIAAITSAMSVRMIDSPMNCIDNCQRNAPMVFRMPTSLALSDDRAVERFMKLTMAISNTIREMIRKILVFLLSNF